DAGDELWEHIQDRSLDPRTVSLMGYSMGSVVIQQLLWQARRGGGKVRGLFFLGGSARNEKRWGSLLQGLREGTRKFYSGDDTFLDVWCSVPIGVLGFNYHYPKTREIDMSHDVAGEYSVTSHGEWAYVDWCLEWARLTPGLL